jgi:hypothetical protein
MPSARDVADDQDVRVCLLCRPVQYLGNIIASFDDYFDIRANIMAPICDLFRGASH